MAIGSNFPFFLAASFSDARAYSVFVETSVLLISLLKENFLVFPKRV